MSSTVAIYFSCEGSLRMLGRESGNSVKHANSTAHLHAFFGPKQLCAGFALGAACYEVKISTPDLRDNEASVWGDWGPMYTCELDGHQAVVIEYRCAATGRRAKHVIRPQVIKLNSPMLATERERCPFELEFVDTVRGLHFMARLDTDGGFDHLIVKPTRWGTSPDKLMFRSHALKHESV